MRVCFICSEIFGWGRYGGLGKLVREIGKALVNKGTQVSSIVWRGRGQGRIEYLDGIKVYSYPFNFKNGSSLSHLMSYLRALPLYREAQADIYHNIEPMVETYIAKKVMPGRRHIIHFQDPYDERVYQEMQLVDENYKWNYRRRCQFYATTTLLKQACKEADALFTQAKCFVPMIKRLYQVDNIAFLPNPVKIPHNKIIKAPEPTASFIGRWDPQKRVEIFLQLARKFPKVNFIVAGRGHNEATDRFLREKYRNVKNLEMLGFVSETEKSKILAKSWILINTSIREGLPLTFLEALAHKTAVLSYVNPDNIVSNFGWHAANGDPETGLKKLIEDDVWKEKGKRGFEYVKKTYEQEKVVRKYLRIYHEILNDSAEVK